MKIFNRVFLLIGLSYLISCTQEKEALISKTSVFIVSYPYDYSQETETVYLSLDELKQNYGLENFSNVQLVSMNNHKQVDFKLCDLNGDDAPELLSFILNIDPKEPIRPFIFYTVDKPVAHQKEHMESYANKLKISYLQSAGNSNTDSIQWSKTVANTFMGLYPEACDLEAFAPNNWTYTNGFFINALCELKLKTGDSSYFEYAQKWIDCFVDEEGNIAQYDYEKYRLDDVLPGRALLYLYQTTNEEKYKKASNTLAKMLHNQPKTKDGGYWHKLSYPHQMWLDGIKPFVKY